MTGTATYTQTFDSLATSGTANAWTDNVTIAGWYHTSSVAPLTYLADGGASNTGRLRSFGTATATDRALGSVASGTSGTMTYGVVLENTSGGFIEIDSVLYTGEQWRNGGNATQQSLAVDYQVSATSITSSNPPSGTFKPFTALNFKSPIANATAAALDGNAVANKTAISAPNQIILAAGEFVLLRWTDLNDAGNDHGLGIDDVTVSWKPSTGVDTFAPTANSVAPADEGAAFVRATVDSLALTFSENVQAGTTGTVSIKRVSDDVEVKAFSAGDAVTSENTATFFFDGPTPLAFGTSYYVEISPGTIEDTAGNDFAGFSGKSTAPANASWTFTVAPSPPIPNIVVNKYSTNASPDTVELLVVGTGAGGPPVNMQGMIIKDFSAAIASDGGGKYEFSAPFWQSIPVGTLIVLTENTSSPDTTVGSGDFLLKIGLDDTNYFTNLDIANGWDLATDEMVMIKAAGSGAAGTAGGIHALAGAGTPGALFTAFTGAKVLAPVGGTGVVMNNTTKSVDDYVEGFDATGALALTTSAFGAPNSGTNASYIASLRGTVASSGDGIASVLNVTPSSPYTGKIFFDDSQSGQSAKVTLNATISSPATTLTQVKITVPTSLGTPGGATLSGAGSIGASVSVVGQDINISSAAVTTANALEVTITGLSTPIPSLVTGNGNFPLTVSTAASGGTLTPLPNQPVVRVVVPISELHDVDSNGQPVDGSTIVAIEGVCTEENFGTTNTQAFIQDGSAGINVFGAATISPALIRGNKYAVVGTILQFDGLTEITPAVGDVIDLGADTQPTPQVLTLATLALSPETYEGKLITVQNLTYVSGTWGPAATVVLKDAALTNVSIRIQGGSTATTAPAYPVNITGIWGQSDTVSPYTAGYQLLPRDPADLVPASLSDYDTWAGTPFGSAGGMAADPDKDGQPNSFEYAFGLNANSGTSVNPFVVPFNKATGKFSFTRRKPSLTGLASKVFTSTTLGAGSFTQDLGATLSVTGTVGDVETVEVTVSPALLTAPKLFIRVVIE